MHTKHLKFIPKFHSGSTYTQKFPSARSRCLYKAKLWVNMKSHSSQPTQSRNCGRHWISYVQIEVRFIISSPKTNALTHTRELFSPITPKKKAFDQNETSSTSRCSISVQCSPKPPQLGSVEFLRRCFNPQQRTIPLCLRGTEEAEYEMDPRTAARRGKPLICMKITLPAKPRAFSLGKTFLSQGGMRDDGAAPRAGGIPSAPVQFKPRIQHWKRILFRKGNKKRNQ